MFHEGPWGWFTALPDAAQRLLLAVLVLIGWPAVRLLRSVVGRSLARAHAFDATLRAFLGNLIAGIAWVALIVVVLAVAGVDLVALMGGVAIGGFVVGFAIKDTLGNLAAGILLLFHRPYRVGETVEIGGHKGNVLELGMALTRLRDGSGKIITLPNGVVLASAIVNHTRDPIRQAEVPVRVAYGDDLDTVSRSILQAMGRDPRVLPHPAPVVQIARLGEDAVELKVAAWFKAADVGPATPDLRRAVREALREAGCTVPYPRRDVRLVDERP